MNNIETVKKREILSKMKEIFPHLPFGDVISIFNIIINSMAMALSKGERVEIRGFGNFSIRKRKARPARNPRNGANIELSERLSIYFKVSKKIQSLLNKETANGEPSIQG